MSPAREGHPRRFALRLFALASVGASLAACGAPPATPVGERAPAAARFEQLEEEILRDLAAIDARLARRARITPSDEDVRRVAMAAALEGDDSVGLVDGAIDPLSFDARARGLSGAADKVAALPADARSRAERELLSRLVDAELARLAEERALPRSASALVRAFVDTWRPPRSATEATARDAWLSRRLAEVRASLEGEVALDPVRARELDDALDALEHLASPGLTAATQELVRLREALEGAASRPAAKAHSDWAVVAERARVHLGVSAPAEQWARDLDALAQDLRARAEGAVAAAGLTGDALEAALDGRVFASGACVDAVPGSRVRSIAAPPEREPACHLRHLVARAEDDAARAVALAAMHDHVVVAAWALDVARGERAIAEAASRARLLVPVLPDTRARYERVALARPIAALAAAETVSVLMAGDPTARAKAWASLGEVPLDVAKRELAER